MASLKKRPGNPVYYIQFYVGTRQRPISTETESFRRAKDKFRQFEPAKGLKEALTRSAADDPHPAVRRVAAKRVSWGSQCLPHEPPHGCNGADDGLLCQLHQFRCSPFVLRANSARHVFFPFR